MNKITSISLTLALIGSFTYQAHASNVELVGKVCKAATASMFGRDYKSMKLDRITADIAYVHYVRPNDNTRWAIKCKLDGNRIIWASNNPDNLKRWRTDPLDDVILFSLNNKTLTITQEYTDGSTSSEKYPLSGL